MLTFYVFDPILKDFIKRLEHYSLQQLVTISLQIFKAPEAGKQNILLLKG